MENELKFNSQICTTIEQSQRLLELGLKPETADMCWFNDMQKPFCAPYKCFVDRAQDMKWVIYPAWSLHRLLYSLMPNSVKDYYLAVYSGYVITYDSLCGSSYEVCKEFNESLNIYDNIMDCIEWLISNGYFNKQFLKQ